MGLFGFGDKKKKEEPPKMEKVDVPDKPNNNSSKSTTVQEENASFQVPDFSEDELDFDLDVNEFLPDMNNDEQNKPIQNNQNSMEKLDIQKTLNSNLHKKQENNNSIGIDANINTNFSKDENSEEKKPLSNSMKELEPAQTAQFPLDDKIEKTSENPQNKNKNVNNNSPDNTKSSEETQKEQEKNKNELPKFDIKSKPIKHKQQKEFVEKEDYKRILAKEDELTEDSKSSKKLTEKILKHFETQETIYEETEQTIEKIKNRLLELDERIFEINQNY